MLCTGSTAKTRPLWQTRTACLLTSPVMTTHTKRRVQGSSELRRLALFTSPRTLKVPKETAKTTPTEPSQMCRLMRKEASVVELCEGQRSRDGG